MESQLGHLELLKTLGCAFLGAGSSVLLAVTTVYALQTRSDAVDEAGNILYQPALGFFPGIAALLVGLRMGAPETEMTLFSKFSFGVKVQTCDVMLERQQPPMPRPLANLASSSFD